MRRQRFKAVALMALGLAACGNGASDRADSDPPSAAVREAPVETRWDALVPNPRHPGEGVLSGGQPTLEQLEALREAGFRTVINLRAEGEPGARAEEIEALGMDYVALPIRGAEGLTEDNARAFSTALEAAERPLLVHCASGNRVGALFALKAFYVDGVDPDEAMAIGESTGLTRLSKALGQHLDEASRE